MVIWHEPANVNASVEHTQHVFERFIVCVFDHDGAGPQAVAQTATIYDHTGRYEQRTVAGTATIWLNSAPREALATWVN